MWNKDKGINLQGFMSKANIVIFWMGKCRWISSKSLANNKIADTDQRRCRPRVWVSKEVVQHFQNNKSWWMTSIIQEAVIHTFKLLQLANSLFQDKENKTQDIRHLRSLLRADRMAWAQYQTFYGIKEYNLTLCRAKSIKTTQLMPVEWNDITLISWNGLD